jgi:hypothetical protein
MTAIFMSEQPKSYNFEQAKEEAAKMKLKMARGDAWSYNEAEEKVEQDKKERELSLEATEIIMEKVQDINKKGTAFTQLRNFKLSSSSRMDFHEGKFMENILKDGVLGWFQKIRDLYSVMLEDIRKKQTNLGRFHAFYECFLTENEAEDLLGGDVYCKYKEILANKDKRYSSKDPWDEHLEESFINKFVDHILGDGSYEKIIDGQLKIDNVENNEHIKKFWAHFIKKNKIGIVWFNIVGQGQESIDESHYMKSGGANDIILLFNLSKYKETDKMFTEYNYKEFKEDPFESKKWGHRDEERKKWGADSEYGLTLRNRISPKDFLGLILTSSSISVPYDLESITKIQVKAYKEKQKMLLPIYDIEGNLLWPKQMSYEEVKKFVEEREKRKEEGEAGE